MRQTVLGLGFGVSLFGVLAFAACGDDSGTGGSGGSTTTTGGAGGAGGKGATVTVTSSTGMMGGALGATCQSDSDCGTGFTCLAPTDNLPVFGGGPAHGYCSKNCSTDADCPNGACLGDGADARCLEACVVGEPPLEFLDSPLDETKCHGRPDVRCQTVNNTDMCVPTCLGDADCPAGLSCDPRFAVCVSAPNTGLPNGEPCDQMSDPPDCAGICVSFTNGPTMCSNWCVLGGEDLSTECGGLEKGICVFSPAGHELGDSAFCTESCTKQDDCQNPAFWCFPVGGITGSAVPNGFCFGADDCLNGQADCTSPNECTDTIYGPKCIDPTFPLGGAGTGGGGTGGGGVGGAGGAGVGGAGGAGGA